MGADLDVSERSLRLSLKTKFISASTNIRYRLPELQLHHVPRLRGVCVSGLVCVASKRMRLSKLFLAGRRPGNSMDAEPIKLYQVDRLRQLLSGRSSQME